LAHLQVAHAHAVALGLAAVGRSDALQRGADLVPGQLLLLVPVDGLVEVKHDVCAVTQVQPALIVDACVAQSLHFGQQPAQVHHDAVADHAVHVLVQDARGHQVKLVLCAL
jgi:hypothetical protein